MRDTHEFDTDEQRVVVLISEHRLPHAEDFLRQALGFLTLAKAPKDHGEPICAGHREPVLLTVHPPTGLQSAAGRTLGIHAACPLRRAQMPW